ncbi:IS1634 family transposase [Kyrpidia spormannii]|uniref:Transposase n=1 Tax=Kyrpidia spormannii TaxID=2055160 RepID=A0ACA8ZE95_9BACL|nr:IS1634 family transposase [Kyrpidia spormannii]CAB3395595.1 transposase [Kyrpidia spormannii]
MQLPGVTVEVHKLEAAPLVAYLCRELRVAEIIDAHVTWDRHRTEVSPGTAITALLVNLLVRREPLYQIEWFFRDMDVEALFGNGIEAGHFNDDRLARALDKFADADPWRIYHEIALGSPDACSLVLDVIRLDTTSFSVQGSYDPADFEDAPFRITRGYSKDLRPDLKQFLFGLGSYGGLPLFADVMSGNQSDKTWYGPWTERITELLSPEVWNTLIVVADSAFVTEENLNTYEKRWFISRMPETYRLCEALKDRAFADESRWIEVGSVVQEGKGAASYRIQGFEDELYGRTYRFVVVESSALDQRKAKRLEKLVAEEAQAIEKAVAQQERLSYHCEADAKVALEDWRRRHNRWGFHHVTGQVVQERTVKRRVGRPRKTDPDQGNVEVVRWRVTFTVEPDTEAIEQRRRRDSTFVLISNVPRTRRADDAELLRDYKGQIEVENLFRALKQPYFVHGIFVKTPKRVLALAYVFLLGLLVYAIIQHRVRQGMRQDQQTALAIAGAKFRSPTTRTLLKEFDGLTHVIVRLTDGTVTHHLQGLTETGIQILRWIRIRTDNLLMGASLPPAESG